MEKNIVLEKSFAFALRILKLCRYLNEVKKEFVLSKELLVSGTGIGKHVKEAVFAESKDVFKAEFGVARRKSADTEYWLELLQQDGLLSGREICVDKRGPDRSDKVDQCDPWDGEKE